MSEAKAIFARCGHPRTPDNIRKNGASPGGRCRLCYNATERKLWAKNRAPATGEREQIVGWQDSVGRLVAFVRRVAKTRKGGIPGVSDQQHQSAIIREWRRDAGNLLDTLPKELTDGTSK